MDEVHFFLEHVDVHLKRRIKLDEGFTFFYFSFGSESFWPINSECRGHGAIEAFQMLAVRVPAGLNTGMENQFVCAVVFVNVDVPLHGLEDAIFVRVVIRLSVVTTKVLRWRTVGIQRGLHVAQVNGEFDVFWWEATRSVANHETQKAGHSSGRRAFVDPDGLDPIHFFFEEFQVHHEVGVVLDNRFTFANVSDFFRALGCRHFEIGGKRAIGVIQVLAVNVPASVNTGVEHDIEFAFAFRFVD